MRRNFPEFPLSVPWTIRDVWLGLAVLVLWLVISLLMHVSTNALALGLAYLMASMSIPA